MPWPWLLSIVIGLIMMWRNHRQIDKNQDHSLMVNSQQQWFLQVADQSQACQLTAFWHVSQMLWIRLQWQHGVQYYLIKKSRVGGARYARLLMAVNHNEQQTE